MTRRPRREPRAGAALHEEEEDVVNPMIWRDANHGTGSSACSGARPSVAWV